jgi:hypothetical protein
MVARCAITTWDQNSTILMPEMLDKSESMVVKFLGRIESSDPENVSQAGNGATSKWDQAQI